MKLVVRSLRSFVISLFCVGVLLNVSCAQETPSLLTGTEMTQDWIEYNEKSEAMNGPKLVFLSMSKSESKWTPKDLTTKFSTSDKQAYFMFRWTNVLGKYKSTVKLYDPRGKLYDFSEYLYRFSGNNWNFNYKFPIRHFTPEQFPGKWTYEVYMNDEFVVRKSFVVGEETAYEISSIKEQDKPGMAILPFFYKGPLGRNFKTNAPDHLTSLFIKDYPQYRQVLPEIVSKDIDIVDSMEIDEFLEQAKKSQFLKDIVEKHDLEMIIVGYAKAPKYFDEPIIFKIYLLDAQTGAVEKMVRASYTPRDNAYEVKKDIYKACKKIFKTVNKKAKKSIVRLMEE